jgi:hypothetical protein
MIKKFFSFLLFCNFLLHAEELNLIESIKVSKDAIIIKPNKELSKLFFIEDFMLQYDDVAIDLTKLDYSILIVPFLLHVVPIIWQQDKTYIIERMDQDLYESLGKIKKVFRLFYPSRNWNGILKAKNLIKNSYTQAQEFNENRNAVIIPFSGGVDSIYNSLATIDKKQYLVTICGGDVPIARHDQWVQVKNHCRSYAQEYHLPLACVRSNFAGIYNWQQTINHPAIWTYMTQGLGYTSLMIPFMVAKGIPFCLIGSASVVDCPWPYGSHPLIEHNLKIAGCYSFHFGAELTRSEKIGKILEICKEHSLKKPKLRVCWKSDIGSNCCECFSKCIVTMVCLLVEGEDYEDFGFSLPLDEMAARLKNYFLEKPLDEETVWKWRFVQRRIKNLKNTKNYKPEIAAFINWLEDLDLDKLSDKSKAPKFSSRLHSIFSSLWSDSLEIARMRFNNHFA